MEGIRRITLVDHTDPSRRSDEEALSQIPSATGSRTGSRRFSRVTVRGELKRRKYAKWQPDRLRPSDDSSSSKMPSPSVNPLTHMNTNANTISGDSALSGPSQAAIEQHDIDATDFASSTNGERDAAVPHQQQGYDPKNDTKGARSVSELEILYENQRGWFFFGIPLYSHSSLLNFDPGPWVTHDFRESPVNITNAQLPDPSWEWAWPTWYVDMSGDVDDQGWQYSLSFNSKAWHGSHPWFHSFVRRRRWVRLRIKRAVEKTHRGRSGFEMAHMLNEDYFTIHSPRKQSKAASSIAPSGNLSRTTTGVEEEAPLEEIGNIPTLMYVLKAAIVDREKIDALKRFIEDGGEELHYLDDKIPEIMSMFVFQNSRWQFLTHLENVINNLSREAAGKVNADAEEMRRKQHNLTKAAETVRQHITGPELLGSEHHESMNLTPASKHNLLENCSKRSSFEPIDNGGQIKGIPEAAEIGLEGHIQRPS
ncbi:meiotically up-regulated gene 65 protein [Aspergillus udagawae]|uniref:Meiotically up-regulated gene 65 protein n=1 Tax=Aspergillus udagawae TaxID=91492 RepID=A0A8H3SEJ0_9EURO|nr:meiotically up-regulated gene 65 protein [Aspergillus udagawae]